MTTEQIAKPANFNYTANSPPRDTTKDLIIMLSIMLEEDEEEKNWRSSAYSRVVRKAVGGGNKVEWGTFRSGKLCKFGEV